VKFLKRGDPYFLRRDRSVEEKRGGGVFVSKRTDQDWGFREAHQPSTNKRIWAPLKRWRFRGGQWEGGRIREMAMNGEGVQNGTGDICLPAGSMKGREL